jgi:hypothetical protein
MDEAEVARHDAALSDAQHKMAALRNVGPEAGAGATIWARVVQDELDRHESVREGLGTDIDLETWERLVGTALMLAVAIDQVLAFEHRVRRLTGDAELARARERFDAIGPNAEALRDLVAHLDAYAVGEGDRQTKDTPRPVSRPYVSPLIYWGNGGGTILALGDDQLNLRTVAEAAVELAQVVERVRVKYLQRAVQDTQAAFERRWRLPPQ